MTLFGVAALLAPVVGPTLGGWLTDEYQWRWIFLHQCAGRRLAFAGCYALVRDPDYLKQERAELKQRPFHFDTIGLWLLVIVMVCWEVVLSKGQEWDWLGDPFWRVQTLAVLFAVGLAGLIFWELRSPNPVVNFRPLARAQLRRLLHHHLLRLRRALRRQHVAARLAAVAVRLRRLDAGLVMSPAGFFAVMVLPIVGFLLGRGIDARWLIAAGLLVMAAGNYWMSQMNLDISPGQVVWPRVVMIVGLSMMFRAARTWPRISIRRPRCAARPWGLFSLLRNEGGSVGTSLAQTLQERRDQFHTLRLGEYLDPFNPAVQSFLEQAQARFLQQTGDPASAQQLAWQALETLRQQQASALAYFDSFWLFAVAACAGARRSADETFGGRERRAYRRRIVSLFARCRPSVRRRRHLDAGERGQFALALGFAAHVIGETLRACCRPARSCRAPPCGCETPATARPR